MRETPRKLAAALLTFSALALISAPATAVAVGGRRNHAERNRHHVERLRGLHRGQRAARKHAVHGPRLGPRNHAAQPHRAQLRRAATRPTPQTPASTVPVNNAPKRTRSGALPRRRAERTASPKTEPQQQDAAVIASVLATPCQNTEVTPSSTDIPVLREAVLCLINRVRAEHSIAPLTVNPKLETAAEGHCAELIAQNYFAHVSPSGETPVDRIRGTGYIPGSNVGYVIGENLAWGTYSLATPKAIVAAWVASPGHLANILESQYTETGVGITPSVPQSLGEGNPGATYAQEFGVIVH